MCNGEGTFSKPLKIPHNQYLSFLEVYKLSAFYNPDNSIMQCFFRVVELIDAGYDVNEADRENVTLLHWASINNRGEVVK